MSAKLRVQWNETTVKFRKIDKLVVFFGTKRSTTPAVLLTENERMLLFLHCLVILNRLGFLMRLNEI